MTEPRGDRRGCPFCLLKTGMTECWFSIGKITLPGMCVKENKRGRNHEFNYN